jgi:hypothetical protein
MELLTLDKEQLTIEKETLEERVEASHAFTCRRRLLWCRWILLQPEVSSFWGVLHF